MINSHTKKLCIILILLIIAASVGWYALHSLIQNKIQKNATYEEAHKKERADAQINSSLRELVSDSGKDIDTLNSRIIPYDGTVEFIEMLETLGTMSSTTLIIDQVTVKPTDVNPETFEMLELSFSTNGTWDATYQLLSMIETLPYKTSLSNVGLTNSELTWNGAFTLAILKYK